MPEPHSLTPAPDAPIQPTTEAYTLRRCRHCGATIAVRDGQRLSAITGTPHACQKEPDCDTHVTP